MLRDFVGEEWREDVRQMNLARVFEVAVGQPEILAHHAEINIVCAENMAKLANHLFYPRIRSHVARAVISGEEEFKFFPGLPAFTFAQNP